MTMLQNAIVLKALLPSIDLLREQLDSASHENIGETEFRRACFVPFNTGEKAADFPSGYALRLRCEEKIIPKGIITSEGVKRIEELEQQRGEPLEQDDVDKLCQDVSMEICKQAFVKTKFIEAFYHPDSELLFINSTSPGEVDLFMGSLIKLTGKIQTVTIHVSGVKNGVTARLRDAIMHHGDDEKTPFGQLLTDDHARVKRKLAPGEPVEVVTYKGTWLANNDELLSHLRDGFEVEEIGLSYPPAAMSFRLTHQFRFKGIDFEPQEPDDDGGEGDDVHDWRMMAMREVEGMVAVVNELCALMEYEQPVLDDKGEEDAEQERDGGGKRDA